MKSDPDEILEKASKIMDEFHEQVQASKASLETFQLNQMMREPLTPEELTEMSDIHMHSEAMRSLILSGNYPDWRDAWKAADEIIERSRSIRIRFAELQKKSNSGYYVPPITPPA